MFWVSFGVVYYAKPYKVYFYTCPPHPIPALSVFLLIFLLGVQHASLCFGIGVLLLLLFDVN